MIALPLLAASLHREDDDNRVVQSLETSSEDDLRQLVASLVDFAIDPDSPDEARSFAFDCVTMIIGKHQRRGTPCVSIEVVTSKLLPLISMPPKEQDDDDDDDNNKGMIGMVMNMIGTIVSISRLCIEEAIRRFLFASVHRIFRILHRASCHSCRPCSSDCFRIFVIRRHQLLHVAASSQRRRLLSWQTFLSI